MILHETKQAFRFPEKLTSSTASDDCDLVLQHFAWTVTCEAATGKFGIDLGTQAYQGVPLSSAVHLRGASCGGMEMESLGFNCDHMWVVDSRITACSTDSPDEMNVQQTEHRREDVPLQSFRGACDEESASQRTLVIQEWRIDMEPVHCRRNAPLPPLAAASPPPPPACMPPPLLSRCF